MRRDVTSSNEVAFADVAMAILGPILLLFLIFLIQVINSGSTPACEVPDEARQTTLAGAVQNWMTTREAAVAEQMELLAARCPMAVRDLRASLPNSEDSGLVPDPLTPFCPAQRTAILEQAGIGPDRIARLSMHQRLLTPALATCLGQVREMTCRSITPTDRTRRGAELRSWMAEESRREQEDWQRLDQVCPRLTANAPRPIQATPGQLDGLCQEDIAGITRTAGGKIEEVLTLEGKRRRTLALVRQCFGTLELPRERETSIQFAKCSTDPVDASGTLISPAGIALFFDLEAERILQQLDASPLVNRVDVFGHTDDDPITSICGMAFTNRQLGANRALYFIDQLELAFQRDPGRQARKEAIQRERNLKFYPIGVGEFEPKDPNNKAVNRRIEIRFVYERRDGAQAGRP